MDGGRKRETADSEQSVDLNPLVRGVMRRWRWVLWPTVAALLASSAFVLTVSPRYAGVAKVLLEDQQSYYTRPDKASGFDPAATFDDEAVQSQAEAPAITDVGREAKAAGAASEWLSVKIEELRGKVAAADAKVEAFRAASGLLASANGRRCLPNSCRISARNSPTTALPKRLRPPERTRPYLPTLREGREADQLYRDALVALADIQVRGRESAFELPPYDRAVLVREMALMPEWFCARHLQLELTRAQGEMLTAAFEFLVAEALAQPQVFVHRDYHSRNLMITRERNPGIIDFQDALRGPVGYDLVSLLKDCYISWPRARVEGWVRDYRLMMHERGSRSAGSNDTQMLRWFDVIGVQRHLKVLGIFARLWYRDGKSGYLDDLPLTLRYVIDTCARFTQLLPLRDFLLEHTLSALAAANARESRQAAPA